MPDRFSSSDSPGARRTVSPTTYYVQPLRSGIARNVRVSYADDRLASLLKSAAAPARTLAELLSEYPTTTN